MTRVIVAGSRTFNDYERLEKELRQYFRMYKLHRSEVEIISGTARGTDSLGEKFAENFGLKLTKFPADWDKYGKSAGYKRNVQMADYAKQENGMLMAFWDFESKGTKHMINIAKEKGLIVNIIRVD